MSSTSIADNMPIKTLNDGTKIPLMGYGTGTALFKRTDIDSINRETVDYIKTAIHVGFHHIDAAELYNTEPEVGIAIKESVGVSREKLFVTTKVINNIKDIQGAIDASLKKLQLDHVDLYLIHSPWFASSDAELQSAWAEMEKVKAAGKAKSIGVSGYLQQHLEATLKTAKVVPSCNQVEFHTYLQRGDLVPWSNSKGIATAAFGPLTPFTKAKPGPCDEIFDSLSKKYSVSPEAIAMRWCIEQGVIVVTTSRKEERLKDYLGAIKIQLSQDEVQLISEKGKEKHFRANNFMHTYDPEDRS